MIFLNCSKEFKFLNCNKKEINKTGPTREKRQRDEEMIPEEVCDENMHGKGAEMQNCKLFHFLLSEIIVGVDELVIAQFEIQFNKTSAIII